MSTPRPSAGQSRRVSAWASPLKAASDDTGRPAKRSKPRGPGKPKAPRKPLPAWVEAGRPIGFGPRRLLWHVYVLLRLYKLKWVPQPRPHGLYVVRAQDMAKWMVDVRQHTMAIITVLTVKGGATKTTVTTWLSAVLMRTIKLAVIVYDIDTGGGKAAKRFELDSDATFESREAIKLVSSGKWDPDYADMVAHLSADEETGVMVFYCKPTKESTSVESISATLRAVKQTTHTLTVDAGPGFGSSITEGAVDVATVACIVGRDHVDEEMDDIKKTLEYEQYRFGDKLDRVLIVISAVRWHRFNTRTQFGYAERFGVKPEQIILIPHIRRLHKVLSVKVRLLSPKGLYAWTHLAEASSRIAMTYNMANPTPAPGSMEMPRYPLESMWPGLGMASALPGGDLPSDG